MSKFRPFEVIPGLSGFKVKIGCSEAYFSTAHELKKAISLYLTNPQAVEEAYVKGDLRYGIATGPTVDPVATISAGQPARPYFQSEPLREEEIHREDIREPNLANSR
jgi:hypothetical protein